MRVFRAEPTHPTHLERLRQKGARFVHKPFTAAKVHRVVEELVVSPAAAGGDEPVGAPPLEFGGDVAGTLQQVAEKTFEELAFLLESFEGAPEAATILTSVRFEGTSESGGELSLAMPENMLCELAANILGAAHRPVGVLRTTHRIIAIGASTGDTEAIRTVLSGMPAAAP